MLYQNANWHVGRGGESEGEFISKFGKKWHTGFGEMGIESSVFFLTGYFCDLIAA